jgi:TonB-dependent SusC/RagA subfamily outer membrane receptor
MLSAWMLYALLVTALIAVGAIAAEQLLVGWRLPRRVVWVAALLAAVGLPIVLATVTRRTATSEGSPSAFAQHVVGDNRSTLRAPGVAASIEARDDRGSRAFMLLERGLPATDRYIIWLWPLASAALGVVLLGGAVRLRWERREWREAPIDGVPVLVAVRRGPAIVGFVRPRVLVPDWALTLPKRDRALILQHELEHIRAGDPYLVLLAALSVLFQPWNLGLWYLARRLTLAIELDCDQRVIDVTGAVRDYGLLLLDVARRRSEMTLFAGVGLVERRASLVRRIDSMAAKRTRQSALTSILLVTGLLGSTIAAMRVPRPAALRVSRSAVATGVGLANAQEPIRRILLRAMSPAGETLSIGRRDRPTPATAREPKPRITATWENAPIELVVAGFAKFTHRTIHTTSDVGGLVTARVVEQPWDEALRQIMAVHGYQVLFDANGDITIARSVSNPASRGEERPAEPTPRQDSEANENRRISGTVIDAESNAPLAGVEVQVIGRQANGESNYACTSERGQFQLVVPDGEAWLDASAPRYQFARLTIAPTDTVALFRGHRTAPAFPPGVAEKIASVEVVKGAAAAAAYGTRAANGAVVINIKPGEKLDSLATQSVVRTLGYHLAGAPLLVIDGVVVGSELAAAARRCTAG